jgi:peptidoglycan/LPS O-acetylase OafA/YrhL
MTHELNPPPTAKDASKTPSPSRSRRLQGLDGLRGIAALSVALYHWSLAASEFVPYEATWMARWPQLSWLWPWSFGGQGVALFFMISGFVILMSLENCRSSKDFLVGRLSRLFPAFWLAVTITLMVRVWIGGETISFGTYLANLTMLPDLLNAQYIDGVYWTLAVELKFYALAFVVWQLGGLSRIEWVCMVWLGIAVLIKALDMTGHGSAVSQWLGSWLILPHASLFSAGIMLYRMHTAGVSLQRLAILGLSLAMVVVGGVAAKGVVAVASALAIFAACKGTHTQLLNTRPMVYLGTISYSVYLYHDAIGFHLMKQLHAMGASTSVMLLTTSVACMTLAAAAQAWVEAPAQAWIKQRLLTRRARA